MIPNTNGMQGVLETNGVVRDFYLDEVNGRICGFTDGQLAVRQAAWLILHTERFYHEIYSLDYGVQLKNLAGSGDGFLFPEIKRRVGEALLEDERILAVTDFSFLRRKNRVHVQFTMHTSYDTQMEMEFVV